jgi:hypothetical protein
MHMDVFNDDAFSLVSLTNAIQDVPHQPGRIGELGLFSEEGISTTTFSIEKKGSSISLVPTAPRGSSGKPMGNDKSKMIPFGVVHLPQRGSVLADEVQNLRAFGTETEVQLAQTVMNRKLEKMRRDLDTTIEYQRIGAIKGQVLDSDGTTVLLDLHTSFGTAQQTHNMVLGNSATKVKVKTVEAKRKIETALGGLKYKSLRALCSQSFFDSLVGHAAVEKAYDRWMNGEFLREDQRSGFYFAGVFWEEYVGSVGGQDFVADGDALLIPEGVPDLFLTKYGPADYMDTVNTMGLPYYAKQEPMKFGKGIEVESQSNPIHLCTRPQVPVVLKAA